MFGTTKTQTSTPSSLKGSTAAPKAPRAQLPAIVLDLPMAHVSDVLVKNADNYVLLRNVLPDLMKENAELYRYFQSSHPGNSVSGCARADEALAARLILTMLEKLGGNYTTLSAKFGEEGAFKDFLKLVRRARNAGGFSRAKLNKQLREAGDPSKH